MFDRPQTPTASHIPIAASKTLLPSSLEARSLFGLTSPVPRPGPAGKVRAALGGPGKSGAMRRDRMIFRLRKIPDPPFTEGPPPWRRIGAGRVVLPPPPLPFPQILKKWLVAGGGGYVGEAEHFPLSLG